MVPQTARNARSYCPNNNKAFVTFVFCLLSSSFATKMASTNVKRLRSLRQLEDTIALPADAEEDIIALPADAEEDIIALPADAEEDFIALPADAEEDMIALPADAEEDFIALPADAEEDFIALPADVEEDIIALPADANEDIIAPANAEEDIIALSADEDEDSIAPTDAPTCDGMCVDILTTATESVEAGDRRKLPGDDYFGANDYFAAINVNIDELFAFDTVEANEADDNGTEDSEDSEEFKKCKKACKTAAEGSSIIDDCAKLCRKVYIAGKSVKKACKQVGYCT